MPTTSRAVKGQVREVQVQSSVLGRLVIVVEIYLGPAAFERYRKIGDADSHACVVLTAPSPTCGVLTVLPTVQKTEPAMLTEKKSSFQLCHHQYRKDVRPSGVEV